MLIFKHIDYAIDLRRVFLCVEMGEKSVLIAG